MSYLGFDYVNDKIAHLSANRLVFINWPSVNLHFLGRGSFRESIQDNIFYH